MVGRQLSRYRIVEEVGSGGMAVVYRGVDTSLDRDVAVKVLHPHLAGKEESRRRFTREAKAVARLHHPNILEIYDFSGDEVPESFIVTEFIRGDTLRRFAEEYPLRPPDVAAMAIHQLADALEHAHSIGVIHRDIKPENVMIREDGCLKLTDFGIAKILDREDRMTVTGALVGSPAHMAPEIIEGEEAGPEADIFSLGTILYWLCTSKLPFIASNTTATLKRVLDGQYDDPRVLNAQVSDGLAEVIARCLARDPTQRYRSAAALRDTLAAQLSDVGLSRPAEELAAFFADPEGTPARISARIVDNVLTKTREFVAARNTPRAMAGLDRILSLQPDHAEAMGMLQSLKRRARRHRQLRSAALALLGVVVAGGVAGGGYLAYQERVQQRAAEEAAAAEANRREVEHQRELLAANSAPTPLVNPSPAPSTPPASTSSAAASPVAPTPEPPQPAPVLHPVPQIRPPIRQARLERGAVVPKEGAIKVVPAPWADIFIDGEKVAAGSWAHTFTVTAGSHTVRLEHPGCVPYTVPTDVPAGGQAEVRWRMLPQPAVVKVVNSQNAVVTIDKKEVGVASQSPFQFAIPNDPGGTPQYKATIAVTLSKQGFKDATVNQPVEAGQTATVARELQPE